MQRTLVEASEAFLVCPGAGLDESSRATSGGELLPLYRGASETVHWTARGLGSSLVREEGSIHYLPR